MKRSPGIYPRQTKGGIVYDAVAMVDGKQRWSRGHRTKREAEVVRDELRQRMRTGLMGSAPSHLTIAEYLRKDWLPAREARLGSISSVRTYRYFVRRIIEGLGDHRLTKLTPRDLEAFKSWLPSLGIGASSQYAVYVCLKEAMRQALRWELISRNPCDVVDTPRRGQHEPPVLSIEAIQTLLGAAEKLGHGALIYLTVMTGMRWGEVSSLRWSNIDFGEALLRIPKAKTPSGVRAVALGPLTLERLREHRLNQMKAFADLGLDPPALVFPTQKGNRFHQGSFHSAHWSRIRKAAGQPDLHFHDLRHVQGTLLARARVHPSIAAGRLGHADPKITLDIYTHVVADDQVPGAAAVEQLLART